MSEHFRSVTLTVNGEVVHETVEARTSLVDFLRERLGLTGSHVGCEQGVCGACTVRLDGVTVRACLTLAVQCAGRERPSQSWAPGSTRFIPKKIQGLSARYWNRAERSFRSFRSARRRLRKTFHTVIAS